MSEKGDDILIIGDENVYHSWDEKEMAMVVNRFDVYLINLDSTAGSEIKKIRPCLIISPDEMNRHIRTVIVASMTSAGKEYPTRISCTFKKEKRPNSYRSDTNNR